MATPRIALFTIASKNYIAYVRVLLRSVARTHPEYRLFLCLADEAAPEFDPSGEPYEVLQASVLGIANFDDMVVRYDIMEFNTAVKPSMIRWLFDHTDADAVIYLDPDIHVYSRLTAIEGAFSGGAAVVLTPHITRPIEDGKTPNDHHMLQAGVFNLGFIGVRRCDESLRFVDWWARRLATQAVSEVRNNLFTDQRWCDLAPCFVDALVVLKDPGYNVAYWNLGQRRVARDGRGEWKVDNRPLAFFHFSGVNIAHREVVSKHQDRLTWDVVPKVRPLFEGYFEALLENGIERTRGWPYAYAHVGELALSPLLRLLYRQQHPQPPASARDVALGLATLALETEPGMPDDEPGRVTRLMFLVHTLRPDLQSAFSLGTPLGRAQFCDWFARAGSAEYQLPAALVPPSRAQRAKPPVPESPSHALADVGKGTLSADFLQLLGNRWRALAPAARRQQAHAYRALLTLHPETSGPPSSTSAPAAGVTQRPDGTAPVEALLDPAPLVQRLANQTITRLMYLVWRLRHDLQSAFDLSTASGQRSYVDWFRVAGPSEYGPHVRLDAAPVPGLRGAAPSGEAGANLIGYAHAEIGMGEHVRMTAAALDSFDVPFGVINVAATSAGRQEAGLAHGQLIDRPRFRANLFHVNADQMLPLYGRMGPSLFSQRYNIGYWAWELSHWPAAWEAVLEMVNEVWAPSSFIHDAIAGATSAPVRHMPLCVTLPSVEQRYDRAHFGLDADAFHFLFTFDFLSYMERKNPRAAVLAFRDAFPRGTERVRLVLKTMNGDSSSTAWRSLVETIDGDPRIVLLDRTMDRQEVLGLCAACDAFVSLHRAEGFGRGPAEAMALGKPVIVTAYSGNMDFTHPDTACLVDYRLVPVGAGEYPMHEGQVWADPDVEHAARHMRRLVDDPAHASSIGRAGQVFIGENFSQRAVGARYAQRLRELGLVN